MYRWRLACLAALTAGCGPKTTSKPPAVGADTAAQDTAPPGDTVDSSDTGDADDTEIPGETADSGDSGDTADSGDTGATLPDLDALEAELWSAYVAGAPTEWSTPTPAGAAVEQSLTQGSATMRYTVERLGSATDPVPLYIALHGGGGTTASVNDSQWSAMQSYYRDSVTEGIYVAPRGITDNWNLHFEAESYPLYDQLIERLIVQENVDPDRVYLLGFSAGGDGVYQIAPRLADRFAGVNMSAGHPNGMPADNTANVAYLLQMGEYDTAYDRHTEAARYAQQLDALEAAHPGLYTHALYLHRDGSHNSPWSDRDPSGSTYPVIADYDAWLDSGDRASVEVDSNAVFWLDNYTREPWPRAVVWSLPGWAHRDGRELSSYWLAVDEAVIGAGSIEASYDPADNSVTVSAVDVAAVEVRLNHHMLDLSQPVLVRVDGTETTVSLYPDEALMAETLTSRGDPRMMFSAAIEVAWGDGAPAVTPLTVYTAAP